MLDPDYLNDAGDMVGSVYSEIESEMLEYLCEQLLNQDLEELSQRGMTAINLLAQTHSTELMAIINNHARDVNTAVAKMVVDAIGRSDDADLSAAQVSMATESVMATQPRQVQLTIQGIAAILERDNVDMVQGALRSWNQNVSAAVTQVNTGNMTVEQVLRDTVRRMMDEGISTITYRNAETGKQTVTNNIDVAVRRHVRTQLAQDSMRRTIQVCKDADIKLVEVSSHGGARPSHARWQGRVFSLVGEIEIDGVTYKDFYTETGYGAVEGLGGANCRHSFGPWIPGMARSYEPDPEHPSGLSNNEVYEMTQEQRRRERSIRKTKRELKGAQLIADKDPSLQNIAEVERLKMKLGNQQKSMREYIDACNTKGKAFVLQRSPNREWAGDMPKIQKHAVANRTMKDFMDSDGVKRKLKSSGVSKSAARKALSQEIKVRGIDSKNFAMLSKTNQQLIFKDALTRRKPSDLETRRKGMKPVNESLYNSKTNYAERHGCVVMRGTEEAERHLDSLCKDGEIVDAAYIPGAKVIVFREKPNTSEVLEETYHFEQDLRGDHKDKSPEIMLLLREIDAQRYLLRNAKRYNIPKEESAQTEVMLDYYLRRLKDAGFNEDY